MKKIEFMYRPFVMIGLIASIALTSCHSEKHHHHEEETEFLVTSPVRMDTVVTKDYVCQIRSSQHIELRALESGYLEEIFVDEGQYVRKGQKMFQIMPRLYQAELQKAQAEVDFAQIEYNNTKVLTDSNIVSANELALAKANLDKAKAEMMLAEVHLGFAEIKAPFDGIMDRFHVRLGSLLEEGELLTELSDNSEMWVYFNVPEAEYLDYMKKSKAGNGTKVRLRMANGEEFNYSGTISAIEADFDSKTGNIAFRATFPNKERLLRHGETGNIMMETQLQDAMLIPQKATFEVLDQRYVFVIDKDNVAKMTRIETMGELPHIFIVSGGITDNDRILLDGIKKVKDGDELKSRFIAPDSVITHLSLYAE